MGHPKPDREQLDLVDPPATGPAGDLIELYTPKFLIDPAHRMWGRIDYDPCSCEAANVIVRAREYCALPINGLLLPIYGKTWCNPPYSGQQGAWLTHLAKQYESQPKYSRHAKRAHESTEVLLLVPASTEARWFLRAWDYPILFVYGRVAFEGPASKHSGGQFGSALIYMGPHRRGFHEAYGHLGEIR